MGNISVSNIIAEDSRIASVKRECARKLAKAKAMYETLCSSIEIRESILKGQLRGSKDGWKSLEKEMHRGKTFFEDVPSIGTLCKDMREE